MSTATMPDTDVQTRAEVLRQLEWDPQVDAGGIGVTAREGTVTLTGYIGSYAGKLAAERAAKRVRGVRAVANDIEVTVALGRTDTEIASDVATALALCSTVPDGVQASVRHGHVTLTGTVDWFFQEFDAIRAVRLLRGVRHVVSHITIAPRTADSDVRRRIVVALGRIACLGGCEIAVAVSATVATLTGHVTSWSQRDAAERTAADAPGIARVVNRIEVESA